MTANNRMIKCYFNNGDENSKCRGYITDALMLLHGRVSRFEEWFLLPVGFKPRFMTRQRIIRESRQAVLASMSKSTPDAQDVATRFYPYPADVAATY